MKSDGKTMEKLTESERTNSPYLAGSEALSPNLLKERNIIVNVTDVKE